MPLYGGGKVKTHTEGTPREDSGQDWSDAGAGTGRNGMACIGDSQEEGEVREAPPLEPSEGEALPTP